MFDLYRCTPLKKSTLGSETKSDNPKPVKNDRKRFLFHVKSIFRS